MKRPRGEGSSGSKQKRAIANSPRGETSGEAPVASTTSSAEQRPSTDDALAYLMTVKETFWDRREKYDEFLTLMKDFKNQRIDTGSCLVKVKALFKEHPNLVLGFNTFVPKGYEVVLPPEEKRPVEFNEAITYVNKIKMRFENTEYVYNEFLGILNKYRTEKKPIPDVFKDISTLFQHHQDLVEEFAQFIPDASLETASQHGGTSVRRDEKAVPSLRQSHAVKREKVHKSRDRNLNIDRPEMEHDKQRRHMEKEKDWKEAMGRRDHELDEKDPEQEGRDSDNEQSKQTPPGKTDESMTEQLHQGEKDTENCATNDVPASSNVETNILKSMYTRELKFFKKVKEKLHVDTYQEFLKCLDLYSKEIISRSELVNLVSDILEKYPDLMVGFNGFLGHCGNIDGFLTGVINKKSSWNGGDTTRPSNTDDRDRDRGRDRDQDKNKDKEEERFIERVKEREKPDKGATSGSKDTALQKTSLLNKKEKYSLIKPISELDLSNCQRCTPSYRLLPANYQVPSSSHKTKIGALVLNDSWVSVTSGSEDYSFKHMRKNQNEEILFRCEDDRFELDMLLETINATTKRVEELLEKVQDNIIELDSPIHFEDHFIPLHLRCIERIYGDHGLDVMDVLRTNASLALPVILTRLKQKQDEWSRCHEDFNKVWDEIYAKNYHKSLDHRSFYFKQQDTKKLSTKALLADIKEIYEKRQKEDNILLANAAGIRQPIVSDMEYEYTDSSIHEDLYTIIRHACEEVCASTDLDKVMRVWTAFLEPILGVLPRPHGVEDTGDLDRTNKIAAKSTFVSLEGMDGHPGSNGTTAYELLNRGMDGGDSITPKQESPCRSRVANGYSSITENGLREVDQISHDRGLLCYPTLRENALGDEADNACLASRLEQSHIRTNLDVLSGVSTTPSKFVHTGTVSVSNSLLINQVLPSSEGVVNSEPILLTNVDCSAESNQGKVHYENSNAYNTEKVYREGAELSPDGDFKEDNSVVFGNAVGDAVPHVKNSFTGRQYQVRPVEGTYCSEAAGENDANVDDGSRESPQKSFGDSEDAYEVGEDASGSESDGEEYSHEDHEEEEEEENGDGDVKAANADEAERMADARDLEGKGSLASSERFLHTVKPLSRHVPEALHEDKSTRIFYGNDSFYILFRLHQTLYERILTAKANSAIAERNWRTEKHTNPPDLYAKFMSALFNLLDGSADNTKFEHNCRATIGTQSYVLFTLDKLIYKVVKQLETVASDEMGDKLLQLYAYEKSRQNERFMDVLYHENARVLLLDQSIYRFESSSNPTWFSIQLMNYRGEKTEGIAASMEPNFAAYLYNDFFSSVPNRKNRNFIFLRRNKRKYSSNDEHSATCMAMEGIRVVNGLEGKISCNSSKISYVLDTEDILYRIGKRKRNSYGDTTACHDGAHNSNAYAVKVQRFHQYLSRFLT